MIEAESTNSAKKIFKDKAIWVGTFIGGPLVAGYFLAENFKVFGEQDKVKKTWIYAILTTLVVFAIAFAIPEDVNIPNQLIPLVYTGIAYFIITHFQGDSIKEHLNAGGPWHNWWRIIGVALIGLLVTTLPFLIFFLASSASGQFGTDIKTYGIKQHEITFNKQNITENEVDQLADALTKTTFFDQAVTKYVYVEKDNEGYTLYLSVIDGVYNDPRILSPFIKLKEDMQSLFPDRKITVKLVVDYLDNVVKTL